LAESIAGIETLSVGGVTGCTLLVVLLACSAARGARCAGAIGCVQTGLRNTLIEVGIKLLIGGTCLAEVVAQVD